jgi:hypothetical protein
MTVYVDDARLPYGRMLMCHMVADGADELHAMADRLSIARRHFHRGHYNICQAKRAKALALGATEISKRDAARKRRALEALAGSPLFSMSQSCPTAYPTHRSAE